MREVIESLYVHIPFCERKCEYCDFASVGGLKGDAEYVDVLEREIAGLAPASAGNVLKTIFFGGGTPGLLDPGYIERLMRRIRETFEVAAGAEITIEVNPSSVSDEKAARWRDAGFNRVSMGVQSMDDNVLRFLGRVHNSDRAAEAFGMVRRGGFTNISCDLIYAVPGLSNGAWTDTLQRTVALQPEHVSAYELTFEPGTPLYASMRRGQVSPVADQNALAQHWMAVEAFQ